MEVALLGTKEICFKTLKTAKIWRIDLASPPLNTHEYSKEETPDLSSIFLLSSRF